jgi:hypothetical protein
MNIKLVPDKHTDKPVRDNGSSQLPQYGREKYLKPNYQELLNPKFDFFIPEQPTDLKAVYDHEHPESRQLTKDLFNAIGSNDPTHELLKELNNHLTTYKNLRDTRNDSDPLPRIQIDLGAINSYNKQDEDYFAKSTFSSQDERGPAHTLLFRHWVIVDQTIANRLPQTAAVMNELANINLLMSVINKKLQEGEPFQTALEIGRKTTADPYFEVGTYAMDVGLTLYALANQNPDKNNIPNTLNKAPLDELIEAFNDAVKRSAPKYYSNKDYTSSENMIDQKTLEAHLLKHLLQYTNRNDIQLTTKEIELPNLGKIKVPQLTKST